MLLPLALAVGSVAAGALLGLGGRRRTASALATFALVSALAVVLAQLLPDALAAVGLPALAVFGLGALLPTLLEKLALRRGAAHADRWGLELGYAALVVHKVGDGIGLGTYGGEHHAGHDHLDVLLAIAAHTVPMVALVTVAFRRASGAKAAALRAGGLAAAAVCGAWIPSALPTTSFEAVEPWITAAVAGLLLHVVAHDWQPRRVGPRRVPERLVDLVAVAAAIGLVAMAGGHDHHGGADVRGRMGATLLELSLDAAPALLIGLALGALLSAFGWRPSIAWLRSGGPTRRALRGALVGAPLPMCACGVLPLASSLKRRGTGAALVVSFLLATPELGVETFALTARFVGWPFAVVRLAAAVGLAVIVALVVRRVADRPDAPVAAPPGESGDAESGDAESTPVLDAGPTGSFGARYLAAFDGLVQHVAPWTAVGLVAAAYVQSVVSTEALTALRPLGLDVLVVTLVAVPSYVCAASATPLAAVLLAKGMSPGAVLAGLLIGPVTNFATLGFLRKSYGVRAMIVTVVIAIGAAWALGFGLEAWGGLPIHPSFGAVAAHEHGWVTIASAALLGVVLARSIWRAGVRGWLGSLGD